MHVTEDTQTQIATRREQEIGRRRHEPLTDVS